MRIKPTTVLQIFKDLMLYSLVMFNSIIRADGTFQGVCVRCARMGWIAAATQRPETP